MEDNALKLSFNNPMLSLLDLSRNKVATCLWNNQAILSLILRCHFVEEISFRLHIREGEQWAAVKATAKKYISEIDICETLKESITQLLWPATYRILLWESTYALRINNKFLKRFYWTDGGRIDNVRTATHIIGNEKISIKSRFVLACSMCLREEIHEIWEVMSKEDKLYFHSEDHVKMRPLLLFWENILEGVQVTAHVVKALETATYLGLLEAVKYIFSLLTADTRNEMALLCLDMLEDKLGDANFLEEDEVDIGFFLLSNMINGTEGTIFESHYVLAMSLLLHSSDRKHFLRELVERPKYVCAYDVDHLLLLIFHKYRLEVNKDYDYGKLFINVWRTIPNNVRSYTAGKLNTGLHCLCILIKDNFPFLLEEGTYEKLSLTLPDFTPNTFINQSDFEQDKWEFLLFLIKEVVTVPSMTKNRYLCFNLLRIRQSNKASWKRLLRFIRNIGQKNKYQKG